MAMKIRKDLAAAVIALGLVVVVGLVVGKLRKSSEQPPRVVPAAAALRRRLPDDEPSVAFQNHAANDSRESAVSSR